jgi:Family of unknown function (DUF6279)
MITMSRVMPSSTPRAGRLRWPIIAVLALVGALLSACSAVRLGYNQAPDIVYWWLDGYADFDDIQSPRVRDALARYFAWHRRTQLPDYAALLARGQLEVMANTSAERACAWWAELNGRFDVALEPAVPDIADLLLTLTPQQLRHVERRHAKANAEFRDDFLKGDAAERVRENVKRTAERAENLYGRVEDAQRDSIAKLLAQSPFDAELWLAERRHRQQDALQVLRRLIAEGATREQAQAAVRAYTQRVQRSPREEYRRYSERLAQFNCRFTAELHNSTSQAQRQFAADKLKGWERDLRALAGEAR